MHLPGFPPASVCIYTASGFGHILACRFAARGNTRNCFPDLHGIDPGSSESIPAAAPLHSRSDQTVLQQEDRRAATSRLRHCRQLLFQYEEE